MEEILKKIRTKERATLKDLDEKQIIELKNLIGAKDLIHIESPTQIINGKQYISMQFKIYDKDNTHIDKEKDFYISSLTDVSHIISETKKNLLRIHGFQLI